MGSAYVSPMLHASYHIQGNQVRKHTTILTSMPSLHKVVIPMRAKITANHAELPSSDFQLRCPASSAAPLHTLQLSSSPSPPCSTTHDCIKAPLMLSKQWRQIQGEKHWEGLIDHPIDATLRAEIIRYGEFAQVCYDAFDFNEHSLYCGSCKYNRHALFEKVDKGGCGYEVTKYLYATSKIDLPNFFKKSERKEEGRWSRESNWIGYVAVCTDEDEIRRIGRRDIMIAWRGTVTATEWVDDLMITQAPANIELNGRSRSVNGSGSRLNNAPMRLQSAAAEPLLASAKPSNASLAYSVAKKHGTDATATTTTTTASTCHDPPAPLHSNEDLNEVVKVETGFLSLYSSSKASSQFSKLSAGQQMAFEVKRLLQKYKGEELSISITGHSLGAALALLCAYDIAANVAPPPPNLAVPPLETPSPLITVYSFGGPRVGNRAFKRRLEELGVRVLRIVNVHDFVPKMPGVLFNETSPQVWPNTIGYHHVGKELFLDFDFSPHLRKTRDPASHHNLEAHLHVLDGFHGFLRPFQSVLGRSPVLVNKSSNFLQKEAFIPPYWWQESNKGLVKDPLSGQWGLASREDDHLPEIHHPELPQDFIGI